VVSNGERSQRRLIVFRGKIRYHAAFGGCRRAWDAISLTDK